MVACFKEVLHKNIILSQVFSSRISIGTSRNIKKLDFNMNWKDNLNDNENLRRMIDKMSENLTAWGIVSKTVTYFEEYWLV